MDYCCLAFSHLERFTPTHASSLFYPPPVFALSRTCAYIQVHPTKNIFISQAMNYLHNPPGKHDTIYCLFIILFFSIFFFFFNSAQIIYWIFFVSPLFPLARFFFLLIYLGSNLIPVQFFVTIIQQGALLLCDLCSNILDYINKIEQYCLRPGMTLLIEALYI